MDTKKPLDRLFVAASATEYLTSPAGALDDPSLLAEDFNHPFTVIALNFDHAVFHYLSGYPESTICL